MSRESIKVLYYTDPTSFQVFGGAEIQMLKTKEHLEKTDSRVSVKLFDVFKDKLENYNIFHMFQMRSNCLSICKLAKARGLKIVLSPIYNPKSEKKTFFSMKRALGFASVLHSNSKDYHFFTSKTV